MNLAAFTVFLAFACAACRAGAPPKGNGPITPSTARDSAPTADSVAVEAYPSPSGRATLVYVDSAEPGIDVVLLITRGDTSQIFDCGACGTVGPEWLTPDLARLWMPIGGNTHHWAVFVEASTGGHHR